MSDRCKHGNVEDCRFCEWDEIRTLRAEVERLTNALHAIAHDDRSATMLKFMAVDALRGIATDQPSAMPSKP